MRSFFDGAFKGAGGRDDFTLVASDVIHARVLDASAVERVAIPSGAKFVNFSATGDFFARFGGSASIGATLPTTDITDGTSPELNPASRRIVDGMTHIALIASATTTVTLSFYGA